MMYYDQEEANKAIKLLEEMCGEKFKDDSKSLPKVELTPSEFRKVDLKIKSGYYKPTEIKKRAEEKAKVEKQKALDNLKKELQKDIRKHEDEYSVKLCVLSAGLSLENFIYYNHTNEGHFNWMNNYKKITQEEFDAFIKKINTRERDTRNGREFKSPFELLPFGIKFILK